MTDPFIPRIGGVMSADVAVPHYKRTLSFYTSILTTGKSPLWRDDLMNNRGMPVIGLGAQSKEYENLPLQWMPHIQVADVSQSVRRALDLGGIEIMHSINDDGVSQWAALLDPNGAAFGVIPVVSEDEIPSRKNASSGRENERIGCISWINLTVENASSARDFYQQIVGWSVKEIIMKDENKQYTDYNMLGGDGKPAAEICHARGSNLGLPPNWVLHLPVGDLTESLTRVQDGGGKILKEADSTTRGCTYAVVKDPVGACIALVQS